MAENSDAFFLHPYDQETTWEGHSSIIHEIKEQLETDFGFADEPGAIVTCVGGGGLAIGNVKVWVRFLSGTWKLIDFQI